MDDLAVYGEIFKYLLDSPASLLRLAKTCKTAHSVVHEYLSGAYNINKHLRPYFDEPLEFRSLQARTATLISGSNALQFFTKVYYDYSDLDLYVPSRHRQEVGRWLLDRGYTYEPHSSQNPDFEVEVAIPRDHAEWIAGPYNTQGISAVFTFTKPSASVTQLKRKQVQLIVATTSPMAAVLAFHSTVVQNVISWDRAYSMYPRVTLTFQTAFIVNRDRSGGRYNKIKNKYIDRGFEFYGDLKQEPGGVAYDDPAFTGLPRQLGDGHCWTLLYLSPPMV
ncbi:hypothetical protein BC629DRAFT_1299292 [Irpex lacteus]|nr:hypothetical protein BC629DRAFT_1299292 [Irpex lacteus]